jgi:CHASE2 domain-containing sensor protein
LSLVPWQPAEHRSKNLVLVLLLGLAGVLVAYFRSQRYSLKAATLVFTSLYASCFMAMSLRSLAGEIYWV